VHRVSTKISPNFRNITTPALHCGVNTRRSDIPDSEKRIFGSERNTRQNQSLLATGLNAGTEDQPHLHLPFVAIHRRRSSLSLRYGGEVIGYWKIVENERE
jgi:hypothetical protein